MNTAVSIDVSKGKSVVATMRPFGEVAMPPHEFLHTSAELSSLTESLGWMDGNTRVILEATGRYHETQLWERCVKPESLSASSIPS